MCGGGAITVGGGCDTPDVTTVVGVVDANDVMAHDVL